MRDSFVVIFSIGIAIVIGSLLGLSQVQEEITEKPAKRSSEIASEVLVDTKTGHRFIVVYRKQNIAGMSVCLIPSFLTDDDDANGEGVPQPRILDSRSDVSFERK